MKREEIEHLATLSRIALSEKEIEELSEDITKILGYVSEIKEIAAQDIEKKVGPLFNVMREDRDPHEGGIYTDALLAEAPKTQGKYVKVKKIITGGK